MAKSTGQHARYGLGVLPFPTSSGSQAAVRVATVVGSAGVGAVVGSAVGRPALLVGLALMAAGAYLDRPQVIAGGAGMAFTSTNVSAARAAEPGAKGRVLSLLDELKGKSYVADLLTKAKGKPLAGLGATPEETRYTYGAPTDPTTESYVRAMNSIGAPIGSSGIGTIPLSLAGTDDVDFAGTPSVDALALGTLSEAEFVLA